MINTHCQQRVTRDARIVPVLRKASASGGVTSERFEHCQVLQRIPLPPSYVTKHRRTNERHGSQALIVSCRLVLFGRLTQPDSV